MKTLPDRQVGFTLVEMIMVIVITGIIGGIVATFLRWPVQGYVDSARRAELTDIADTAFRRMARDVRTAVPNSVRMAAAVCPGTCVEFLPTKDGGRYSADLLGNPLNFGVADGSFNAPVVGPPIAFAAGDFIVVGSAQSNGAPAYDQTANGVLRAYASNTIAGVMQTVNFANTALPTWAELPSRRFSVVDGTQQAVTYACINMAGGALDANQNGQGQLVRYSSYGFNPVQAFPAVNPNVLANRVSACNMNYVVQDPNFGSYGLLEVQMTLTSGGESVTLYNEIHVNNAP